MFGEILTPDGAVYEGDSRAALRCVLDRARKDLRIDDFKCGPELEYFIFPSSDAPTLTDVGGYFISGRTAGSARRSSSFSTAWASRPSTTTTKPPTASTRSTSATRAP